MSFISFKAFVLLKTKFIFYDLIYIEFEKIAKMQFQFKRPGL